MLCPSPDNQLAPRPPKVLHQQRQRPSLLTHRQRQTDRVRLPCHLHAGARALGPGQCHIGAQILREPRVPQIPRSRHLCLNLSFHGLELGPR
eukprot:468161-Rhodomonas_salina.2